MGDAGTTFYLQGWCRQSGQDSRGPGHSWWKDIPWFLETQHTSLAKEKITLSGCKVKMISIWKMYFLLSFWRAAYNVLDLPAGYNLLINILPASYCNQAKLMQGSTEERYPILWGFHWELLEQLSLLFQESGSSFIYKCIFPQWTIRTHESMQTHVRTQTSHFSHSL